MPKSDEHFNEQDSKTAWANCLQTVQKTLQDDGSFNTWFRPIVPLKLENNTLTIQVPSQFFYEYLEQHYVDLLQFAIGKELGPGVGLEYSIIIDGGNSKSKPIGMNVPARQPEKTGSRNQDPKLQGEIRSPFESRNLENPALRESHLNPSLTFDTYIEGPCNRLARAGGVSVANKPGHTIFNPLLVYGGVGLGKTHLIHSIGNRIKELHPEKFVLYVSTQKFTDQFTEALANNRMQDFNDFYMQVDVLMLDDIQLLAGRTQTQQMMFTLFNHLHDRSKQIILTSDCAPADLQGLHDRLKSRFKWGLMADLQVPDFETRVAIIRNKMQREGTDIPYEVVEYLAEAVDSNIRELEGVMVSLIAQTSLNGRAFTLELAKQIIRNIVQSIEPEIDIDYIQKAVSEYFSIPTDALKAKTRKADIVQARMVAMFFAKEFTNFSLESIGNHFGGRHHSTVIHAIQSVNELIDHDLKFKSSIQELQRKMKVK